MTQLPVEVKLCPLTQDVQLYGDPEQVAHGVMHVIPPLLLEELLLLFGTRVGITGVSIEIMIPGVIIRTFIITGLAFQTVALTMLTIIELAPDASTWTLHAL